VTFSLRVPRGELVNWAVRYVEELNSNKKGMGLLRLEEEIEKDIAPRVKADGYFTKDDLQKICKWKARGEDRPLCAQNEERFVRIVTQTALATPNERFRIVVLGVLEGIDWPEASALLHFGHPDSYPVIDIYSLQAVGIDDDVDYDFDFWSRYTQFSRLLVKRHRISMRELHRALWQYGKESPHP
jgi:hypothetical protein